MRNILLSSIFVLLSQYGATQAQCDAGETTSVQGEIDAYLVDVIMAGLQTESTCTDPYPICSVFETFIDDVIAIGADGQCYLEAYDYFEAQRVEPWGIECSFEEMVGLCPDAAQLQYAVNGNYGDWSDWSNCDCDTGNETRSRDCDAPPPINAGYTCIEQDLGDATEIQECTNNSTCDSSSEKNRASGLTFTHIWLLAPVIFHRIASRHHGL